jgi:hypothetical protein
VSDDDVAIGGGDNFSFFIFVLQIVSLVLLAFFGGCAFVRLVRVMINNY